MSSSKDCINHSGNILDVSGAELNDLNACIEESDERLRIITEVYADYNNLERLPTCLTQVFAKLRKLSCIGNDILALPSNFGQLESLTALHLNDNDLKELPESFTLLRNLSYLNVIGNHLKVLPEDFGKLSSLTDFKADENKLSSLPSSFCNLGCLVTLELSANELEGLPDYFGNLVSLIVLNLSENKLERLPESFSELKDLCELDISRNRIKFLPRTLKSSNILRKFYADSNQIEELPLWCNHLPTAKVIRLQDNKLQKNPLMVNFANNDALETLDLGGNFITELPKTFGNLKSLKVLYFGSVIHELERRHFQNGNWMSYLPDSFCHLKTLIECHLDENQLRELPSSFGLLESLEYLDLGQNNLYYLPDSFCDLKSLKTCQLSKNHIKCLPSNIGNLSSLLDLRLDNNLITSLPDSFIQLTQLKTLDLFNNFLTALPVAISCLTNLTRLDLASNNFGLKMRDIPMVTHNLTYAERDPSKKDNWRGRKRADQEVVPVIELPPSDLPDDDEDTTPTVDSGLFERAIRRSLSLWKSHTDTSKAREVFRHTDDACDPGKRDADDTDSEWEAGEIKPIMNISSVSTLRTQDYENRQLPAAEDDDWDAEMLENGATKFSLPLSSLQTHDTTNFLFNSSQRNGYLTHDFVPSDVHVKPFLKRMTQRQHCQEDQFEDVD